MPAGILALLVAAALIFFGLAHRVLDRLRLTDGQALAFIGLLIAGSFVDIPLLRQPVRASINVGGAVVPLVLAGYLLARADSTHERVRSLVGAAVTAAVVLAVASLTDFEPGQADFLDPLWLFSGIGGLVGYLVGGRSRRAAFISGTLGLLATDVVHVVGAVRSGLPATALIGGAGAFDMVVIAGLLAVGLAEAVGETRERLSGGPGGGTAAVVALAAAGWLVVGEVACAAAPAEQWGERIDGGYYTLVDGFGRELTKTAVILGLSGVYIDPGNVRWEVERQEGDRLVMRRVGPEPMPQAGARSLEGEAGPLAAGPVLPARASAPGNGPTARRAGGPDVAVYFTHSDESYVPTSGTEAKPWGDIYRVGEVLAESLRAQGYRVVVSTNNHNPHDGQAYTRSRRTAVQLLRQNPAVLVDVHRDAVPPQVYETTVQGQPAVKVRLVVGRQNQNVGANLEFAKRLKVLGDRRLPGLVEGIFIGEGDYNQDLSPRAVLLEFGAHTNPLERAEAAARLFGPLLPQAGGTDPATAAPAGRQLGRAAWRSLGILVLVVAAGLGAFLWLNAPGGQARAQLTRVARAARQRVAQAVERLRGVRPGGGPGPNPPAGSS